MITWPLTTFPALGTTPWPGTLTNSRREEGKVTTISADAIRELGESKLKSFVKSSANVYLDRLHSSAISHYPKYDAITHNV
jgi:hypothetical protein